MNKASRFSVVRSAIRTLCIEHSITADMADGQPLPPYTEDGVVWHVVRRTDGRTLWRRIFLSSSSPVSPVTDRRTVPWD
jgi:hypothetical protein